MLAVPALRSARGLLDMSAATIDQYLAPVKARDPIRGKTATKSGRLLRSSITLRKAGDEVEAEPGFFKADTVTHCGPPLKGEFCRSVNFTDVHTGWVFTHAIRNNAHVHILGVFDQLVDEAPFNVTGIDRRQQLASSSTTPSSARPANARCSSLGPAPTRRTTRPRSSRRTTIPCAATASTTATTP